MKGRLKMNDLQLFNNAEFGEVRTATIDGKPYVAGVDVARVLEYAYPSQAVGDHCKGIVKLPIPSGRGEQETNMIPEGDIYRLIIKAADQSRSPAVKEKAERFEKWLFDEVLPSIRKTGGYFTDEAVRTLTEQVSAAVLSKISGVVASEVTDAARRLRLADELTDGERCETEFWKKTLTDWREFRMYISNKEDADRAFIAKFNDEHPGRRVSRNTIYRKWKNWRDVGDRALLDTRGRHDNHVGRVGAKRENGRFCRTADNESGQQKELTA
jgi:prophage antirepressor-like protein